MNENCDIAIIGAGAAGMATGIFAAEAAINRKPRIVLLDGAKTLGAKILVSGGGRCNVTHYRVTPDDFVGPKTLIRNILAAFNESATVRWMQSLGVLLTQEPTGKLFPVTDSAKTVVNALLTRLKQLDVDVRPGCRVIKVTRDADAFTIAHSLGELSASRVILCTGGRSLPRTGSDGAGYALVRSLGHTATDTFPALAPLVLDEGFFHAQVSGLSHQAELSTFVDGRRIDCRIGSLLWTHFGISGPVAMDASRFWTVAHGQSKRAELRCNFLPGQTFEKVEPAWIELGKRRPKLSTAKAVAERIPERLAEALLRFIKLDPGKPLGQLSREDRRTLVHALTALPIPVLRDRGWNYAEVTAGGVPLEEIDFRTMASRKTPGLYLAGEILDCDGRIGGFNFQWAWATGYLAGRGAVKSLGAAG